MNDPRSDPALLKHYRLNDPNPIAWADPIEEAQQQRQRGGLHRQSTVRYSVLQEEQVSAALRGLIGDDLFEGGSVPRDEPDPLGTTDSVVRVLRQRGLPVEDNVRLR